MSFTSVSFLLFITAVFVLYYATPKRYRYITLLLSSYFFYYVSSKGLVLYLLVTTVSVYLSGFLLLKYNERIKSIQGSASLEQADRLALKKRIVTKKKLLLTAILLLNFGILAALKYGGLLSSAWNFVMPAKALKLLDFSAVVLPLGISFYTFQSMGYLIDVYRGKYKPERNIAKFALFVSFFPQIVQGPIARYDDLAHQLYEPHSFDYTQAKNGILLIGWGFIRKLLVADRLAGLVSDVFNHSASYSGSVLLVAAFAYGLQVYCDFSGGMDIASGVAQVMGIRLAKNFLRPYYANSIADFWRRWHVTLGAWMRDYLFYPLSLSSAFGRLAKAIRKRWGSRWSKIIVSGIVSFIVFTVVGIWHGAEAKYILYGFWNGGLIMMATLLEPLFNKCLGKLKIKQEYLGWKIFRVIRTIFLLSIGRSIVCSLNGSAAIETVRKIFFSFAPMDLVNGTLANLGIGKFDLAVLVLLLAIIFFIDYLNERGFSVLETIGKWPVVSRWAVYYAIIFALMMLMPVGGSVSNGFIYAQF